MCGSSFGPGDRSSNLRIAAGSGVEGADGEIVMAVAESPADILGMQQLREARATPEFAPVVELKKPIPVTSPSISLDGGSDSENFSKSCCHCVTPLIQLRYGRQGSDRVTAAFLKVFRIGIRLGLHRLIGLASASASFVRQVSVHAGSQPRLT